MKPHFPTPTALIFKDNLMPNSPDYQSCADVRWDHEVASRKTLARTETLNFPWQSAWLGPHYARNQNICLVAARELLRCNLKRCQLREEDERAAGWLASEEAIQLFGCVLAVKWKDDGLQAVIARLCVHFSRLLKEMCAALNGTFDVSPYCPSV